MIRHIFTLFFLFTYALFASKQPEISSEDVVSTLNQIMEAHTSHKELSELLIKRALEWYLEELDPTRTYLLKHEIEKWIDPSEELTKEILSSIKQGDFTVFTEIHKQMIPAIERRNRLEKSLQGKPLPDDVSISEFTDISWETDENGLLSRLLRIKALQAQAAAKLDPESQEKALLRIEKRRVAREEEITCSDSTNQKRLVLSHALKALAASFDTHTSYFTPAEANQFMIQVQQRLFGIGAQLRDDLNGFTVTKIIEGGPACPSDLKVNDIIIAIDKEPVVGLEIIDAVELIRGEEGTKVLLTVLRPTSEGEEKREIEITRGEVVIKRARIESDILPYGDGVIAHIALHAFYQDPLHSSSADLYEEIHNIKREHKIKGIILDLRQNSGGLLPEAVAVSGLFVTKGIIVSIKDNHGNIEHLREIDVRTAYEGPLIILTSKASASAAEIVAQTLQDYGRALVVGDEHTYGKGTFQTFTLDAASNGRVNPKGEFKVTRGRYYTVSGKSPQLVGVKPDIIVPGFYSALEIGERYAKYPLENDSIKENFQDDLSDIPQKQRDQISWLYRFNLQPRLNTFNRFLPQLQKNSEKRISNEILYQNFLAEIEKEDILPARLEWFTQEDLQLKETINIIKDLILLLQ
ncbi:MAG: S41 family peptidase [Chlamydiales bacterium]